MKLYDKNGKEYSVPHAIDAKEWKREGYTEHNPKSENKEEAEAAAREAAQMKAELKAEEQRKTIGIF